MQALSVGTLFFLPAAGLAQTATDSFDVRITISAECEVSSTGPLDFGNAGPLTNSVNASTSLQVTCSNTTPYTIGLDAGVGAGADTTTRRMTSGGSTIGYRLFRDSALTSNWGNTPGADTLTATGTGTAQSFTVYGQVSAQATPAPGTYTDTVTVTVTY